MALPAAIAEIVSSLLKIRAERSVERQRFLLQKQKDRWDKKEARAMEKYLEKMLDSDLAPFQKRLIFSRRFDELTDEELKRLFPDPKP